MQHKDTVWLEHGQRLYSTATVRLQGTVEKGEVYTKEQRASHDIACSLPVFLRRVNTLHVWRKYSILRKDKCAALCPCELLEVLPELHVL